MQEPESGGKNPREQSASSGSPFSLIKATPLDPVPVQAASMPSTARSPCGFGIHVSEFVELAHLKRARMPGSQWTYFYRRVWGQATSLKDQKHMEEQTLWVERPALRDMFINPVYYLLAMTGVGAVIPLYVITKRLTTKYTLTTHRLIVETGIISKRVDDIELYRIKDTKSDQGVIDRLLRIGSVNVNTTDTSGNWNLRKISSPRQAREKIRHATEQLKHNRNVRIHTE
jgi:membrane protein YdbS with pleckstrin-like domain